MFQSKVRDSYQKNMFFLKLVVYFFFIPAGIFLSVIAIIYIADQNIISYHFFKKVNIISMFVVVIFGALSTIVVFFIKKSYIKKIVKEHLKIVAEVKLPKELPKVLYVYTTHNDFMPARLLQNMKQTYKNMEYWISDGSSDSDVSKQVKEFSLKHNVNLFKMDKPSKDKSDNLNTFLKFQYENQNDFEYIVTSDSDVAFHEKFVEVGIRYFYSDKINRLGFVDSSIYDYEENNIYNIGWARYESVNYLYESIFDFLEYIPANMAGACSITKKEFLKEVNDGFFCELFEDWYTTMTGIKNLWTGIMSPLVISQQSMENNIFPTLKRYMRYFDWSAKFFKNNLFLKFNDEHSKKFWKIHNNTIFYFPKIILLFVFFSIILCICLSFYNTFFVVLITLNLSIFFLYKSGYLLWKSTKLFGFKKSILLFIITPLIEIAHSLKKSQHWFKSVLGNKITEFIPTRSINKNIKRKSNWCNIKNCFYFSLLNFVILFVIDFLTIYFNFLTFQWWLKLIVITLNIFFGYLFFGSFSIIILFWLSFIKTKNNYSSKDFIKFNNDVLNFTKIKDEFFKENSDIERFC